MAQDINKFLGNDEIFNKINSHFIKMDADEIKERNDYLKKVLEELVSAMRKQSLLFHRTYQKISWCGSFFKGTRFGAPKEYDVHFVIDLRLKKKDIEFSIDQVKPGFIKIRMINNDTKLRIQNALNLDTAASREFNSFFDERLYLNQDNFRNWIERILSKVARATSGNDIIKLCGYAPIKIRKSGPAFTLTLKHKGKDIDIDLVPVLDFSSLEFLPPKCSKMNLLQCDECWSIRPLKKHRRRFHNSRHRPRYRKSRPRFWSVVPKPLSNSKGDFHDDRYRYWRLCFYEFEKDMLSKNQDYGRMKPVIRQLKKLRDTQGWVSVKSYFLETLCYHEKEMFHISQKVSHTFLFFKMLEKLYDVFYNGWLPYYWDDDLNLLENIGNAEMMNRKCRLEIILKSIRKEIKENSYAIAKWVLTKDELEFLKNGNYVETPETESESESNQWNCVIV